MSAGLLVECRACRARTELRIDMAKPTTSEGGDAVKDLRRSFDAYGPLVRTTTPTGPTIRRLVGEYIAANDTSPRTTARLSSA